MPEQWQRKNSEDLNSRKRPMRRPFQGKYSKKTPEKANLDTIRRRERRQRSRRGGRSMNNEEFILSNDNRFMLLSETDEEETSDDDRNDSEAESKGKAMKNNRNQKNSRQANTTTEVPMNSEHVAMNKSKPATTKKEMRGNNQQQPKNVPNLVIEKENILLNESDRGNEEFSFAKKDKQRTKLYLQGFKLVAYLKTRVNNDRKLKSEFKDTFNELCAYAQNTVEV